MNINPSYMSVISHPWSERNNVDFFSHPEAWILVNVNEDDVIRKLYNEDIQKRLRNTNIRRPQKVLTFTSTQFPIPMIDAYKIHLHMELSQIEKFWTTIIAQLEENSALKAAIYSIKSTTYNNEDGKNKLRGRSHVSIYSMPGSDLAQYVLDQMILIFGSWTGKSSEMEECYHIQGMIYYSGGNRIEKKHVLDYHGTADWTVLFQNLSHILWKGQIPLSVRDVTQVELDHEVMNTSWYQKAQKLREDREREEKESDDSSEE